MPSVLSHPAVPLALALGLGRRAVPPRLVALGVLGSMLPDLDVVALRLGLSYASDYSHRGFTHSLAFAALLALAGASCWRWLQTRFVHAFLFLFAAVASHGLLDTLTNGGMGIALAWPFSSERYFAPFQPVEVSPLGIRGFFSARGVEVLQSEFIWIWLPALALVAVLLAARTLVPSKSNQEVT
jgi:inner membrane protein